MFDLSGTVAMVTGASSGIGRAMAIALARAGAKIVLVARRKPLLDETAHAITRDGGTAAAHACDLGAPDGLPGLARKASEPFGPPLILVNAAGINLRQPAAKVTQAAWNDTLFLNLGAPFFLARELVPHMAERRWGRILNVASLQSVRAFPDSVPYGASKGGVVQLTRAMAQEWSPRGINCNAIAPGFFPTELTGPVFADAEKAQALAAQTMVGRNGRLEDVHGVTVFLASRASDYVTGQTIFVDGGFSAR